MSEKNIGHCTYCDTPDVEIASTIQPGSAGSGRSEAADMCKACYAIGMPSNCTGSFEPATKATISLMLRALLAAQGLKP